AHSRQQHPRHARPSGPRPRPSRRGDLRDVRVVRGPDRQGSRDGIPARDAVCRVQAARGASLDRMTTSPAADPEPAVREGRNRRLVLVFALLAATVFVADQLTKVWALGALEVGSWQPLLGDWIQLTLVFNPGAALSFGTGMTWLLTIVAAAVTIVVIRS